MRLIRTCRFLLPLLVGALAGCARFEAVPVSPQHTAAEFQKRGLEDPGLKAFIEANLRTNLSAWPVREWSFQHLTLVAFYFNSDLDLARAHWAVTDASIITAGERPNPTLGVVPAYCSSVSVPSPWLVTPTLDIPIETAGKRRFRSAQANELSAAARLNITTTAWQVRSKVRKSLLDIYQADETKTILEQQQGLQDESFALLERQHAAGAISSFELAQARLGRDGARLALHDAKAQSADARAQLAAVMGMPSSALDGVQFAAPDFGMPKGLHIELAREQALLHRADICGALAEYAASQSALQLEIAKQYPDVNLGPGYEYDQGNNKWSLGLTVTLPLLNRNKGAITEALARRSESAANFNAIQAKALAEIDSAWAAGQVAQQRLADANTLFSTLQKQEKISQTMFDAGEIAKADLAAQRLQLSGQALARLDATVKSQLAIGCLEDALQTSLDMPATAWERSPREGNKNSQSPSSFQHP